MSAKALLSASVSAPPAVYVEDVFSTYLYTGNGSTQTITNGIDLSGEGGLVWLKNRTASYGENHALYDSARGIGSNLVYKDLSTDSTYGQSDKSTVGLSALNSDGFTVISSNNQFNNSAYTYASWTFRKAEKFFDVVTFTAAAGAYSATVNHSLGSTPGCIIVKCTSSGGAVGDWNVWHRSLASDKALVLNSSSAQNAPGTNWITANSTSFSVNGSLPTDNATYVAYLFAHDAGGFGDAGTDSVVSCGSYTADGSGNFSVELGWEPQLVIFRDSSAAANWEIIDNMRGFSLTNCLRLFPNLSNAEGGAGGPYLIPSATGFRMVGSASTPGATGIYIAIRRGPMKTPESATEVFDVETFSSDPATVTTGFPVDMIMNTRRDGTPSNAAVVDRLRGSTTSASRWLETSNTDSESIGSGFGWDLDSNTGWKVAGAWGTNPQVGWSFRRAPGFFDVVAYTGTGANRTVSHNLGVAPELIIVKRRNTSGAFWAVQNFANGATKGLYLNGTEAAFTTSSYWNNTSPTASVFTVGTNSEVNGSSNTYIAYLFATLAGVSKVGSYTGTGTTLNIDCGFTAGARFVLIKRTDSTGDWYVWDTARGIISGDDPYLLLNSTAAEVTNTDYIDPLSSGFQITSTAPAAINASGGSFIFLAIA